MQPAGNEARPDRAAELAEVLRGATPRLRKLLAVARPRADAAGRQALRYAREHEGEIKQAASTLARYRVRGPLGLLVRALTEAAPRTEREPGRKCAACGTANVPSARFCNQCGSRLEPAADRDG